MTFHSEAQERADQIRARRESGDLTVVPPQTCDDRKGAWVCIGRQHPLVPNQHYFVKENRR